MNKKKNFKKQLIESIDYIWIVVRVKEVYQEG